MKPLPRNTSDLRERAMCCVLDDMWDEGGRVRALRGLLGAVSRSRPTGQANLRCPDASRIDRGEGAGE